VGLNINKLRKVKMKNKFLLLLTCSFSAAFLFFVWKLSDDIQRKEEILLLSPAILNVTDQIKTKALVTEKDLPSSSWANIDSVTDSWKEVKIPDYQPITEKEFKNGNFGYYRILVPHHLIDKLGTFKDELEFSPQYVFFSDAEIWRNGHYLGKHSYRDGPSALLTVPIEPGVDNIIAIKGKIKAGDSGIKHRGKILLGRKSEIRELHTASYKGTIVFPLIFLLCKGSVIFVFALIYLLLNVGKFFEKSLVFSLCAFGEDLLTGEFLGTLLNINLRVYCYNFLNIIGSLFLFLFLADVLEKKYSKKTITTFTIVIAIVSYLAAIDILHTSYIFNFNSYLISWNVISMAVIVFYVPSALKKDRVLVGVMFLALVLSGISLFYSNVGLNYKMFGNLLLFFMVAYQSFALFRREQLKSQAQEIQLLEQEKDVAIGKTASLLAHDVRRPLEQMKLILEKVSKGEVSEDFLKAAKNDVNFSITSVNNQINDIMNYSKSRQAELSDISFYHVLSGSLKQIMTINKGMNLSLEYDFKANMKVMGDESRLSSALTNLISNAVEAIRDIGKKHTGVIRLTTQLKDKKFIFKIFNDGPAIPKNVLADIWKPLFTHGKESGTGLGLSSVMKTINDHKGSISARNVGSSGVEFEINIEASEVSDELTQYEFHKNSRDYNYEIKSIPQNDKRPFRIFLLDDDVQVEEYFRFLIQNLPFQVEFTFASHFETAKTLVHSKRYDLYILDYDLGDKRNGLEFYHECLPFLGDEIVIHSGREQSIVNGEKCLHQKKPMSFEELNALCEKVYLNRLKILLIDDSELTRMTWEMFHGRQNIELADSPETALKILTEKKNIDLCVVDFYFDNSQMNGEKLVLKIKELHPEMKIILASNTDVSIPGFKTIDKHHFDVRNIYSRP
jgi:signal transduction histidine kinase/response regulator of citrate/malate metabolism